ncbi:MAG: hypothetical protein K0S39_944 [Paenibacillus sp.]|nr:hypothetical protein [Paenibacillus sp.]
MKNKFFFRLTIGLLLLVQIWFSWVSLQAPYLGINLKQDDVGNWKIKELEVDSASLKLNVQVNDTVLLINGQPAGMHFTVEKWQSIEQAESITVSRYGSNIEVDASNVSAAPSTDIFPLIGEVLSLLFAALLYIKPRYSPSSRFLSLVFVNIGFIFASLTASQRGDTLGKLLISSLMIALPVVFLHFLIVFLKERAGVHYFSKLIKYLYVMTALSFVVRIPFFYVPSIWSSFYFYSTNMVLILFLLGLALNFTFLSYLYIKYRKEGSYLTVIIKTVWVALAVSFFPFAFLSFVPMLFLGYEWVSSLYTSWFVLFFPISFAYLIISKQLYDIDIVLRRIVFTIILSIIPSAAITALNVLIFRADVSVKPLLFSFIFTSAIISTVLYSLEYFTTKLEKTMFPRKYHLQNALKNIATNLRSITSFQELKDIILIDVVHTLQVFGAAIVFKYNDRVETVMAGDILPGEVERLVAAQVWDHPSYSCLEINHHEEYTSYLIITRKRTNTLLVAEEIQWINLIISYLAVSLENLHLIGKLNVRLQRLASQIPNEQTAQDIMWFRKLMFELQETERKRIATDLHDTTMQDLFFLKKRFASVLNNYSFEEKDRERMNGIMDYVEIINTNLRQNCFELHPHLLHEIGLIRTVERVVEHEEPICPFQLEFSAKGAEVIESWDMDTKRHVFRIIQELINNAKKHSEASKVNITVTLEADTVWLKYEDDGVGFISKNEVEKRIGASGTGLEQMRSRVLHLNGRLEMDTGRGKGMAVTITLPIRKVLTA